MKRTIGYLLLVVALIVGYGVLHHGRARASAVAGGGIPITNNVSSSTNGTPMLLANANRGALLCQNIGTTNNIFVTFGQTPTTTNGFLLAPNGGWLSFPEPGCVQGPGKGCVPLNYVSAIASGSGTNTLVCWED
jgi:hypothetical protein